MHPGGLLHALRSCVLQHVRARMCLRLHVFWHVSGWCTHAATDIGLGTGCSGVFTRVPVPGMFVHICVFERVGRVCSHMCTCARPAHASTSPWALIWSGALRQAWLHVHGLPCGPVYSHMHMSQQTCPPALACLCMSTHVPVQAQCHLWAVLYPCDPLPDPVSFVPPVWIWTAAWPPMKTCALGSVPPCLTPSGTQYTAQLRGPAGRRMSPVAPAIVGTQAWPRQCSHSQPAPELPASPAGTLPVPHPLPLPLHSQGQGTCRCSPHPANSSSSYRAGPSSGHLPWSSGHEQTRGHQSCQVASGGPGPLCSQEPVISGSSKVGLWGWVNACSRVPLMLFVSLTSSPGSDVTTPLSFLPTLSPLLPALSLLPLRPSVTPWLWPLPPPPPRGPHGPSPWQRWPWGQLLNRPPLTPAAPTPGPGR